MHVKSPVGSVEKPPFGVGYRTLSKVPIRAYDFSKAANGSSSRPGRSGFTVVCECFDNDTALLAGDRNCPLVSV